MTKAQLLIVLVLLAVAGWVYYTYNPATTSFFPRCPTQSLLGFYCAGCGSQRALHQLLHGHWAAAADFNLLATIYLPLIIFYYLEALAHHLFVLKHRPFFRLVQHRFFVLLTLTLVLGFSIVRNLSVHPFFIWLQP
jgi:hypothetical protein